MDVDPSAPRDRACHGRERRSLDLAVYQTLERYDTPLGPDENVLCGEPGLRLHAPPHLSLYHLTIDSTAVPLETVVDVIERAALSRS